MTPALRVFLFCLLSFASLHSAWADDATSVAMRCPGGDAVTLTRKPDAGDLLDTITKLGVIGGGIWALVLFVRDRRTKTIETMISLENEFRRHAAFLLTIETNYSTQIRPALEREARNAMRPDDETTLKKLDALLRHLVVCLQARNTGVVRRQVLDGLYGYHLRMLANRTEDGLDDVDRSELSAYIERYWRNVAKWAGDVPGRDRTMLLGLDGPLKGAFRL